MEALSAQFLAAGVRPGGVLLLHSSLSSLGTVPGGADTVIDALLHALGPSGTLVLPTLSYLFCTKESPAFDVRSTPTNLGAIPSAALRRAGALRSLHPTHSCCALGARSEEVVKKHWEDTTPVGRGSPFSLVRALKGQVGFLGCGTRSNTSIHGAEELLSPLPPYLLLPDPVVYRITDAEGRTRDVVHRRHNFEGVGQRYERLPAMVPAGAFSSGPVGAKGALLELFDAEAMWSTALEALRKDPWALCARVEPGSEGHHLKAGGGGAYWGYTVGGAPATAEAGAGAAAGAAGAAGAVPPLPPRALQAAAFGAAGPFDQAAAFGAAGPPPNPLAPGLPPPLTGRAPGDFDADLFPSFHGAVPGALAGSGAPFGGGGAPGAGGMTVGPGHPLFGGWAPEGAPLPPGALPGARFDPFMPPGGGLGRGVGRGGPPGVFPGEPDPDHAPIPGPGGGLWGPGGGFGGSLGGGRFGGSGGGFEPF